MDMNNSVQTDCGNGETRLVREGQRGKTGTTVIAQTIKMTKKDMHLILKF